MGALTARYRALWLLALGLPVLCGVAAFVVEDATKPNRPCRTGTPSHGALFYVIFLALAVLPIVVVAVTGWRSRRGGEDTAGPFAAVICLSVMLVFIGLLAGWHGAGCIT